MLEYLAEGTFEVKREAEARDSGVVRKVYRIKPVLPTSDDQSSEPGDATRGAGKGESRGR